MQVIQFTGKSTNSQRQDKSHIHATVFTPDEKYLLFTDLGSDQIRFAEFDSTKSQPLKLSEKSDYKTVDGSGPRHLVFHPNKKYAYCIEELSGTISSFNYDEGKLINLQRIFTYSKLQNEYNAADIHITPDGLFLYASNRLEDENSIAIFSIDQKNGILKLIGHQKTYGINPRSFTIDPSGKFILVANQSTNNIVVFKRNLATGTLKKLNKEIQVNQPSCLKIRTYFR